MRKACHLFLTALVFISTNAYSQTTPVRNTETFINYFTSIKEIKDYTVLKDTIESVGARAKNSARINPSDKLILQALYDTTQHKSEVLYNKIVSDLLSKDRRQMILQNPDAYVASINFYLDNIKGAGTAFIDQYKHITGDQKAIALLFILFKFLLPVAKEFITETLDNLVRQKLDKYLKPQIVIKPWANL